MYSLAHECEVSNGEGDSVLTISDTAPPLHFDHEYNLCVCPLTGSWYRSLIIIKS